MTEELYEVTLNGETALLGWKNGKIVAQGYDLESEKIVLALNSNLGEGIGVLLVAIDELGFNNKNLKRALKLFSSDVVLLSEIKGARGSGLEQSSFKSLFTPLYLSFDHSEEVRAWAVANIGLRSASSKRLIMDSSLEVIRALAENDYLDNKAQIILARHSHGSVRYRMAMRLAFTLCDEALLVLLHDSDKEVRRAVRGRYDLPDEARSVVIDEKIEELLKEKNEIQRKIKEKGKGLRRAI